MDSKTQTNLIYVLAVVALVLLYKVFNWDTYRCDACNKAGYSNYLCAGCATEDFRFQSFADLKKGCNLGKNDFCQRLKARCKQNFAPAYCN
jgi:hypothetical protein